MIIFQENSATDCKKANESRKVMIHVVIECPYLNIVFDNYERNLTTIQIIKFILFVY